MSSNIWVFGYGSLIWNPGFEYSKSMIGQIQGYSRRFYQGSDVHRGSPQKLGRVVTLIEDEKGSTWGQAYLIKDKEVALSYLGQRESSLGGYTTIVTTFYPRDPNEEPFFTLVYIALPSNRLFLGSSPVEEIAKDIASTEGECGPNVDYLFRLVAFMRIELPYIHDHHLEAVERSVQQTLEKSNPQLLRLLQDAIDSWLQRANVSRNPDNFEENYKDSGYGSSSSPDKQSKKVKFIDSVSDRHMRCVKKY